MKTLLSFNKISFGIDNLCISKLSARMCGQDGDSVSMETREEMTALFTRLLTCKSPWMATWVNKT